MHERRQIRHDSVIYVDRTHYLIGYGERQGPRLRHDPNCKIDIQTQISARAQILVREDATYGDICKLRDVGSHIDWRRVR